MRQSQGVRAFWATQTNELGYAPACRPLAFLTHLQRMKQFSRNAKQPRAMAGGQDLVCVLNAWLRCGGDTSGLRTAKHVGGERERKRQRQLHLQWA